MFAQLSGEDQKMKGIHAFRRPIFPQLWDEDQKKGPHAFRRPVFPQLSSEDQKKIKSMEYLL